VDIPRLASSQALNNIALIAIAAAVLVLSTVVLAGTASWFLRSAIGPTRSEAVKDLGQSARRWLRAAASILVLLTAVVACSLAALTIYTDFDVHQWANRSTVYLKAETGRSLLRGLGIIVAVIVCVLILRRMLRRILAWVAAKLRTAPALEGQEEKIGQFVDQMSHLTNITVIYVFFELGGELLKIPSSLHWLLVTAAYVVLVLRAAQVSTLIVTHASEALDRVGADRLGQSRFEAYYKGVRNLWPLARRTFDAISYLAAATLIIKRFETLETFAPYGPRIIRLLGIFFFGRVAVELSRVVVYESFARGKDLQDEIVKRRLTLVYLIQSIIKYVIYFGASLLMMEQIGVSPAPFLAGAGIIGLAVGLGAQKLVNDMVSGFFILFEGHLLTGDFVQISGTDGTVEAVQLRTTILRDLRGRVHSIRNGDIGTIINYTREYIYACVDVNVGHECNLNQVFAAINESGRRLRAAYPAALLADPGIDGVDQIHEGGVLIGTTTKVVPGTHRQIQRAFRRIMKETFEELGIAGGTNRSFNIQILGDERLADKLVKGEKSSRRLDEEVEPRKVPTQDEHGK
jgi:moderate conductance mechanosensitive channel